MVEPLTIDGKTLTISESLYVAKMALADTECTNLGEVREYLKNHKVEEYKTETILRNPDFHGWHFSIPKEG